LKLETVAWHNNQVVLIDQSCLPERLSYRRCRTVAQVWEAIRSLKVRGAPAIGAAAGLGLVLGVSCRRYAGVKACREKADAVAAYLASARPTAVNLAWALERVLRAAFQGNAGTVNQIQSLMLAEAQAIIREDRLHCRAMANNAQPLIKNNARIMTYCNAGILATIDYGTALGVIYRARELKKTIKVYSCETRPFLQGARLTCWELRQKKIDVTLLCDNMAGDLMRQGKIDVIFIGADRIARNGDTANKIGSYSLAVLARHHRIPLYVVAPHSTFDLRLPSGKTIPVEQRDGREVSRMWFKKPMVPEGVKIYNPSFDVIPHALITALVTESGIIRPPYVKSIQRSVSA
jgi:methylthioribose-1-phosphate isomerase